jgi:hypothetical protein
MVRRSLGGFAQMRDGRMKGAATIGTATVLMKFLLVVFIVLDIIRFRLY